MNELPNVGPSYGAKGVSASQGAANPKAEMFGPVLIQLGARGFYENRTDSKNPSSRWAVYDSNGRDITQALLKNGALDISPDGKAMSFKPGQEGSFTIRLWVTDERGTNQTSQRVICERAHGAIIR